MTRAMVFDLGQTTARLRLVNQLGEVLGETSIEGRRPHRRLTDVVEELTMLAAERFNSRTFELVCGGATGVFGEVENLDELAENLWRKFRTKRLVIADDAVTSYLGAMGRRQGVVCAVGTGIVTLALGPNHRFARVGGIGPILGDDGAGYWIGKRGLLAATHAMEGRPEGSECLRQAALERYGSIEGLPRLLTSSNTPVADVARFAEQVAQAARSGDLVSASIWHEAGTLIAREVMAAADQAGVVEPVHYSVVGRIANAMDLIEASISEGLSSRFAGSMRLEPYGESIDGAALLANDDRASDFSPLVDERNH